MKARLTVQTGLVLAALVGVVYIGYRLKHAAGAAGAAIGQVAGTGWNLANAPVWDASIPGAGIANSIVATPASVLDTSSFGLIGGSNPGGSGGVLDTLKAGPFGGLVGMLTGDNNSNVFGPAPSAGLDLGNGAGNW